MRRAIQLEAHHEALKRTSQRGELTPAMLAALVYLRGLDREFHLLRKAEREQMAVVEDRLYRAWAAISDPASFPFVSRYMDEAQQRMHWVIRRMKKKELKRKQQRKARKDVCAAIDKILKAIETGGEVLVIAVSGRK